MKIYTVLLHGPFGIDINTTASFKERGDAEEYILANAQENEINCFNNDIQWNFFSVDNKPMGEDVMANWIATAKVLGQSLESYSLFRASEMFIVENELY